MQAKIRNLMQLGWAHQAEVARPAAQIGKLKKRALVSGMQQSVEICVSAGCDRPAADGSDYCCSICKNTSQFGDPNMPVDHSQDCSLRARKFFNQR